MLSGTLATRVESVLDDADDLGHLDHVFGVLSGSNPQIKIVWMWPGYHMFFRKQCWRLVSDIGVKQAYLKLF